MGLPLRAGAQGAGRDATMGGFIAPIREGRSGRNVVGGTVRCGFSPVRRVRGGLRD